MLKRAIFYVMLLNSASAFAIDSSGMHPPQSINPMHLEPTTKTDSSSSKPVTIDPSSGGKLSCPVGFALTSIKSSAEVKRNVTVYTECNGIGNGFVHTWCSKSPVRYSRVSETPTVTYACQKITNQWVDENGKPKKA